MSDFFAQPIVSNTGPLLCLSRIGQLSLLTKLFPRVIIPKVVVDELLQTPHADVDFLREQLLQFTWPTEVCPVDPLLQAQLDPGEAAAIALASRRGMLPVLMDERKGRRVASLIYGLSVMGTGGLLVAAKHRGLISTVRPMLEQMLAGGYHLGPSLIAECLRRAGE